MLCSHYSSVFHSTGPYLLVIVIAFHLFSGSYDAVIISMVSVDGTDILSLLVLFVLFVFLSRTGNSLSTPSE